MKVVYLGKRKIRILAASAMALVLIALVVFLWQAPTTAVSTSQNKQIPVYCVSTEDKKVSITFDASWGNEQTEGILDLLDQYNVKATFFLVGYWVDAYPEQVKMITERGHEIGNHSSTHPHMSGLSRDQILTEIGNTNDKITALTGQKIDLFRPPYGEWDENLVKVCRDAGYQVIQWNIDSLDWKGTTAEEMVARVQKKLEPGSIILFHNNSEHILEGLKAVLEELTSQGYQGVKVSDLIYDEPYTVDHEGRQFPASTGTSTTATLPEA